MSPPSARLAYLVPAPGIPIRGPSGASAHVRGFAAAAARTHDLRLYAARMSDHRGVFGAPVGGRATGVPGWPSWLRKYRNVVEVRAARRIVAAMEHDAHEGWVPDVVVERWSLFSDAGWRASDQLGCRWVLEVNAPLLQERLRFEPDTVPRLVHARRWQREVLLAAPEIVAVSRWLVDWLQSLGCRNVRWVPNGVETLRGDRARGRARLGLDEDTPAIGFLGSMKPWHGLDRLPAIAQATGARLVLLGRIHADRVPPGAIAPGFLTGQELADAISALDVGLAPYPADAPPWFCPLKVLDYRAQKVPVVGTDVGDVAELVGDAGTVVPPGDGDGLVDAVKDWMGRGVDRSVRGWGGVVGEVLG